MSPSPISDGLPIIPADATRHNVVCHYCIVGCGYHACSWPVNRQGGTAPEDNVFGVDLAEQQGAETAASGRTSEEPHILARVGFAETAAGTRVTLSLRLATLGRRNQLQEFGALEGGRRRWRASRRSSSRRRRPGRVNRSTMRKIAR